MGIYVIQNIVNGKRYVGQTVNTDIRWAAHRRNPPPKMCADVEYYGWDAFSFGMLEECPREKLTERENYYIELLKPEYNTVFKGYVRRLITCLKISRANMGHYVDDDSRRQMSGRRLGVKLDSPERIEKLRKKSLGNKSRSKAVYCIETETEYPSAKAAAKALGIHPSGITGVLAGRALTAGKCHWRYVDEDENAGSFSRCIEVICIETNERFPSIEAAARHFKINAATLADIIKGESISVFPYHFRFANEERKRNTIRDESSRKNYAPIPIFCFETNETYSSIRQAAKALGITNGAISSVLNGRSTHADGFHFEYADGRPSKVRREKKPSGVRRPIRCLENNEVYESIAQAAKVLGVSSNRICAHLHDRVKEVKNLHFEYIDMPKKQPEQREFNEIYLKRNNPVSAPARRPIMCIETEEKFDSISQAGIKMNLDSNHIGDVIRGHRNTVGGYHFIALDDESDTNADTNDKSDDVTYDLFSDFSQPQTIT